MKPVLDKKPNGNAQEKMNRLVAYLSVHRLGPNPAIEIANHLGLHGEHEVKRRHVRQLVQFLHADGHRICASDGGYWIARSHLDWENYCDAKKRNARYRFVVMKKTNEAVTDRMNEQQDLFDQVEDGSKRQWAEAV